METIILQQQDPAILDVATICLQEHYNVLSFEELPQNFLQLIIKTKPIVVILDYIITGSQAIAQLNVIKKAFPLMCTLAMSCNTDIQKLAHKHGFEGYIQKPFNISVLIATIKQVSASCLTIS